MSARTRRHRRRKRMPPPGARPGTLALPEVASPTRVSIIDYGPNHVEEKEITDVEALTAYRVKDSVTWVNVAGLSDENALKRIGEIFSLHPLALADAVNVPQRPKFESYELHHLMIMREAEFTEQGDVHCEQVSLAFAPGFVVMFQEDPGDCFEPVRTRIRTGAPIRQNGADFLAYALLDCLIDNFFPVLETLGDRLEELEEEVMGSPTRPTLVHVQQIRRQLVLLHRTAWQQRDATNAFMREERSHFSPSQQIYLRDCYDHAVQVIDTIETYREMTVSLVDVYHSNLSNRLNEVMKILTIMSSVFIPLTFIAGVYGMNFDWMPELRWKWGYPAVLALMLAVALVLLRFFRRKGWLGAEEPEEDEVSGGSGASPPGPDGR